MSNNYTQFSVGIEFDNMAEHDWWLAMLREAAEYQEDEYYEAQYLTDDIKELIYQYGGIGFEYDIGKASIICYSEECGYLEVLTEMAREFLRKFQPKGCLSFEAVNTCSKPRVGEFGGYGYFITKDDIHFHSVFDWLRNQEIAHKEWNK